MTASRSSTTGAVEATEREVWARLARVTDPELDEPVTELGFVDWVRIEADGAVALGFRLPTYWCAANFAFMMADDMRLAVAALPWVSAVRLTLDAHMYAEAVNRAMQTGMSFKEAFGAEASDEELAQVRRRFAVKSFQRRQGALLGHLLVAGHDPKALLRLSVAALGTVAGTDHGRALVARYLERRDVPGPAGPGALAFVDEDGAAIAPGQLPERLRLLRRVAVNTEFNGALCRGLLASRYGEEDRTGAAEPTLLDFIRAVPKADAMRD